MLMKLLDWVGWSERKWKMPTCMKISRLCRLLVVQIGAETVTFMLCWFHTNPSKIGLDLNKSTEFQRLSLWTRLSAKPFSSCENEFYLHANKNHFRTNGFALRLALKQRLDATEKWPITASGASWPRAIQVLINLEGSAKGFVWSHHQFAPARWFLTCEHFSFHRLLEHPKQSHNFANSNFADVTPP